MTDVLFVAEELQLSGGITKYRIDWTGSLFTCKVDELRDDGCFSRVTF